ncbi:membrane protein [Beggiatoa sp. SS]|nr:membrane protein [Beggiatoa sp. SS]
MIYYYGAWGVFFILFHTRGRLGWLPIFPHTCSKMPCASLSYSTNHKNPETRHPAPALFFSHIFNQLLIINLSIISYKNIISGKHKRLPLSRYLDCDN